MTFANYFVYQRCASFGENNKRFDNTHCCCYVSTQGAEVFQKLYFVGVCGARGDSQLKQAILTDYSTAKVTEEEVYLHVFINSSLTYLLHGAESLRS